MRKILLTSSGFETEGIMKIFHSLFDKKPKHIQALFIPTAAICGDGEGIGVLPKCLNDLVRAGIPQKNITVFDLHRSMPYEELSQYDLVYFTGGSPQYLQERINATGFCEPLRQFIESGGVYVGVSAGSCVATNNLPDNLGLINCTLSVHAKIGTKNGVIDVSANPHIHLTGKNVILILGEEYRVTE